MTARPAEHLVHGLDGAVAVVPGRVAALLLGTVGLANYTRGQDPELDAAVTALKIAAAAWRTTLADHGNGQARRAPSAAASALSTADAARRLGCAPRTVRWAIASGRLEATTVGGRWVITAEAVEHYRAARAA